MTPSEGALKKADKDAEELRPLDCEGVDWPLDCESCGEINSVSQLMLQRYKAGFREGAKLAECFAVFDEANEAIISAFTL